MEPGHTFKDKDLAGKPAALYCRVSSNPDETEQRSVDEQETEGLAWAKRTGVTADVFKDDDRSASMFARKQRENFTRLREAIEAGRYQVVWFWATSRQTRGDVNIYELAKVSADHGVLWCVAGQLLNPANEDDLLFLGIHHLMDRQYAWRISKDVRRAKHNDAHAGKPNGVAPYGYRHTHDFDVMVKGRPKYTGTEPNVFDGDGRPIADSPAYIVREIFDRVAAGEALHSIRKSLEERRIPLPRKPHVHTEFPCRWSASTVRGIATNPAYVGKRTHHIEELPIKDRYKGILDGVETTWPPLVTEEQWWAVQRILGDPKRLRYRSGPGRRSHLLSSIARCAECGGVLSVCLRPERGSTGHPVYRCHHRGCVSVREDWLDAYVEDRIVSWLADSAVYTALWQRREDDNAVAAAARADIERLQHQIEECRANGEDPDADAVFWERRARALTIKLREAEDLARPASLSPVLAGLVGPDAADKWWKLRKDNPAAARQVIQMTAGISIRKSARQADAAHVFDPSRVGWMWRIGDSQDTEPVFGDMLVDLLQEKAAAALRADPRVSDNSLARRLFGPSPNLSRVHQAANVHKVRRARRVLEDAGDIPVIRRRGLGQPVNYGYQPRSMT
jgi:DNA invertase Pin-like site-specific DNA recombinase